jgi:fucose permease
LSENQQKRNGSLTLLLISYLGFIVIGMPGGVLNVAWVHMEDTFSVSLDSIGGLLLVGTVGSLLVTFTSGAIISRIGIGVFLLIGSFVLVGGMFAYTLAPVWILLIAANIISSVGLAIIDINTNTFVTAKYAASRLNWLHACFGIGQTAGNLIATFTIAELEASWRWSYGIIAVLGAVFVVSLLLTFKRWRMDTPASEENEAAADDPAQKPGMLQTLRQPAVWLGMAMFFVYAGAEIAAPQLSNSLFVDGRAIDVKTAGFWISLYWGVFTVGRIVFGGVVDWMNHVLLLRLCMVGVVVGAIMIWWHPSDNVSFAGLALMGFAQATIFPTLLSVTPGRVGVRHTANAIGLQVGAAGLGIAVLPGLGAWVADHTDLEFIGAFLVLLCVALVVIHEVAVRLAARQPERVSYSQ